VGGPVDSLAVADLQCGSIAVARQWDQGELFRTLRPTSVVEGTSKGPLRRRRSFSRLAASHFNAMRPSASDSVPLLAASEVPMRTFVPPWFTARWSQMREVDLYSFPMELFNVQVARLET
jgi:hypothetical protein